MFSVGTASSEVTAYSFPEETPKSDRYQVTADDTGIPAIHTARGAILSFGMSGPTEIRVQLREEPESVVIRPLNAGIEPVIENQTIRFRLPGPQNLSVEIDGDLDHPLLVFANPVRNNIPDPDDPKVRYFEGGKIHEAGEILLGDDETLYLEGGAIVRGLVRARGAENVAIRGPGILDAGTRRHKINMLVLRECEGALLEDFTILDPLGWTVHLSGSENIRLTNTRVVGWRANSDGLDIEYTRNVRADGCFWRTNDDCIAVKALYPPGVEGIPFEEMINPETLGGHSVPRREGDVVGDVEITNCILWNDSGGQGFEVGFELRVDTVRGVTFRDCDIIHVRGGGAFTIHNGDRARIEGLRFEDVRIENTDRLFDFHIGLSIYSDDCPDPYRRSNPDRKAVPREHRPEQANNPYQWYVPADGELARFEKNRGLVRNVVVRDVKVLTKPRRGSIFNGYNETHGISGVRIEGLEIEGKPIRSAAEADFHLHHVYDLEFAGDPEHPSGE
jgi:hypothetical protein